MMRAEDDPLTDDKPGGPCKNAACDHGWVHVAKDENGMFLGNHPADPAYADRVAHTEVYPCPECDPSRFLELTEGCFNRRHTGCERCAYRRPKTRSH
jgi:hypothetical protein